jgi:hypothetical protein
LQLWAIFLAIFFSYFFLSYCESFKQKIAAVFGVALPGRNGKKITAGFLADCFLVLF